MRLANIAPSSSYLRRKAEEIATLAKFAPSTRVKKTPRSVSEVFAAKLALKAAVRASAPIPPHLSDSNLGRYDKSFSLFGFRLKYDYQRILVTLEHKDHVRAIYKGMPAVKGAQTHGFFTSSCQAAISVFFDALDHELPKHRLFMPNGGYWETVDFLKESARRYTETYPTKGARNAVLYFDSSTEDASSEAYFPRSLRGCSLVAIDTTCFSLNSRRLHAIIQSAVNQGVPCVLLRSHMKLDCMATEYGRLGSFVLVKPKKLSRRARAFCDAFQDRYSRLTRYYGVHASLQQLYPFFNDVRFHHVNNRRVDALRTANAQVTALLRDLSDELVDFKFFRHNLFFWIILNRDYDDKALLRMFRALSRIMSFHGVPVRFVASYPWDELGITFFRSNQFVAEQGTKSVVRVSVPDLDPEMAMACADGLRDWIKGLKQLE